eukprot:3914490-Amphidinium_carterae.1
MPVEVCAALAAHAHAHSAKVCISAHLLNMSRQQRNGQPRQEIATEVYARLLFPCGTYKKCSKAGELCTDMKA